MRIPLERSGLAIRLLAAVVLLSTATLGVVGFLVYRQAEVVLTNQLNEQLTTVVALKSQRIDAWVHERQNDVVRPTSTPLFERRVAALLRPGAPSAASGKIRGILEKIRSASELSEVFLVEPRAARVVVSTDPEQEGKSKRDHLYFREGRKAPFVQHVSPSIALGPSVIAFSAPVRDGSGRLLAILVARVDLRFLDRLMAERSGLRRSGQTFLVNRFNDIVSGSPGGGDHVPRRVFSEGVTQGLAGGTGTALYANHDGVTVVAAYRWLPALGLALVAEIEQQETLEPIGSLRLALLAAVGLVSALALAAGLTLNWYFTRPVSRLVEAAHAIGAGNLDHRVTVARPGELATLGQAMNRMAKDVGTSRRQLEARSRTLQAGVEERTTALRASEERFRLLFAASPLPLWAYDHVTLQFLEVNDAAVKLYGYSCDEFLKMRTVAIQLPEDVSGATRRAAESGAPTSIGTAQSGQRRHRTKDGRVIDVEVFAHPLEYFGRTAMLVALHDITERKQVEAQLHQSQKMDAVGRLAGGVAHDFNNLMTVIMSRSELLLTRLGSDLRCRRDVDLINKTARRAADLTRRLLAFSRRQVLQRKVVNVNAVVSGMLELLHRVIREDIELATRLGAVVGTIKADPVQLEQVILNLVVNARDAMPEGGVLTIETADVEVDGAFVRRHPGARPGPHVALEVRDTGHGLDADTLAHIFEPFFTTKGPESGTGLGLATVYGIAKQHDGYIVVESEPDRETTFTLYFPRVQDAAQAIESAPRSRIAAAGSETILVVEDETEVRSVTREILKLNGYTVLEANSGVEALGICGDYSGPIHLLVTDVVLPKMGGEQVARRLVELRPGMKILYISGHADDALGHHGVLDTGVEFLAKPFTPGTLADTVRRVLDSDSGANDAGSHSPRRSDADEPPEPHAVVSAEKQ